MKKTALFLSIILSVTLFSACTKLERQPSDTNSSENSYISSGTIQEESPMPNDSSLTDSQDDSSVAETTTTPTTTKKPVTTTKKPITTTTTSNTTSNNNNGYTPINYDVQKGVWISYIENEIVAAGKTESQYRQIISNAYQNVKNLGCNTVYVQVRAFGDAYYPSSYFPRSTKTSTSFDQLQVMIDEAHKLGISFHAWINPMRGPNASNINSYSDTYPIKQWYNDGSKNGNYVVQSSLSGVNYYFLNPAYPEVRQLISNGVREIVQNYKVDGIQIDDYFYPTTSSTFDANAYAQMSGGKSLGDWRRSNTDSMVASIYSTIKSVNSRVLFGVSPQGNNSNNYSGQFINVPKWCSTSGYVDYILPQFYYEYNTFTARVNEFKNYVTNSNIKFIVGLAPYKVVSGTAGFTDGNILSRQIQFAQSGGKYGGVAFFRYANLVSSNSLMQQEIANFKPLL